MSGSTTGSGNKRIPAGELSAYERWELPLINDGSAPASVGRAAPGRVKPPTAEEVEQIHRQAHAEGLAEGRKAGMAQGLVEGRRQGQELGRQEGLQQGLAEARKQVDQQLAALASLMQSLLDPLAERQSQIEEALVNLAMTVARSVIYRELTLRQETLAALVRESFLELPARSQDVLIRLNAADSALVNEALKAQGLSADLRVDAKVSAGGLMVETRTQLIDFTLEKRFQKTVHAMLCRLSQPVSRREPPAGSERLADASEFPVSVLQEAQQEATEQASAQAPIGSPGADVNVLPDGTSGGDDESDRN